MDAMSTLPNTWLKFLAKVRADYPAITFQAGQKTSWSSETQAITFNQKTPYPMRAWSLLHELAHCLLKHQSYLSDFELLKMEVEAWKRASELAGNYGLNIHQDHIDRCLNTYRDWLHQRSCCPYCNVRSIQISGGSYKCLNCRQTWHVSDNRLVRPYRRKNKKSLRTTA